MICLVTDQFTVDDLLNLTEERAQAIIESGDETNRSKTHAEVQYFGQRRVA